MKKLFSFMIGLFFLLSVPMMVFAEEVPTPSDDAAAVADFVADEGGDEGVEESRFNMSGFLNFQWQKVSSDNDGVEEDNSLSLTNLNLYLDFKVSDKLQVFSELRILGNQGEKEQDINSTTSYLGSIFIERAYVEYNEYEFAKLRGGRILTPYGIWSQDHGAPVLTSVRVPFMVAPNYNYFGMPTHITGIELFGTALIPIIDVDLDYNTYVANNTSVDDNKSDFRENKSYGGYLNFRLPEIADMISIEVGGSGYLGARVYKEDDFETTGLYAAYQNDKIALAHLKVAVSSLPLDGTFILQGEITRHWIDEQENQLISNGMPSPMTAAKSTSHPAYNNDHIWQATYIQAEYQLFGWITPYYRFEHINTTTKNPMAKLVFEDLYIHIMGINVKPTSDIVIKAEWDRYIFKSGIDSYSPGGPKTFTSDEMNKDRNIFNVAVSVIF